MTTVHETEPGIRCEAWPLTAVVVKTKENQASDIFGHMDQVSGETRTPRDAEKRAASVVRRVFHTAQADPRIGDQAVATKAAKTFSHKPSQK